MKLHPVDIAARRRTYQKLLVETAAKLDSGGRDLWPHEYVQLSHQANYYNSCVHTLTLKWMLRTGLFVWFTSPEPVEENKKTR